MTRRRAFAHLLSLGSLATAVLLPATAAEAATQYTVKAQVPKPSVCNNHGTIPAGGWLANKPCGYIVGTAPAGTRFDVNRTSGQSFHFGRSRDRDGSSFCAWLVPRALDTATRTRVPDSCSASTSATISHRLAFGRDFDNAPHQGNGAATVPVDASACTGYANYFTTSTYAAGRLRDAVGYWLPRQGAYRYTTKDGKAALVRVGTGAATTWLFVPRACIASQLKGHKLSNAND